MVQAELKKLLHNGSFRIFLCIFLLAGILSPLAKKYRIDSNGNLPSDYTHVYTAYNCNSVEEVLADTEEQIRLLEVCQGFEILADLPPEIAEMLLEGMIDQYGLTEEKMAKLDIETLLRFTDSASREITVLTTIKDHAERISGYPRYLESIQTQVETIRNSILYKNNPYALSLAEKTAAEYAPLLGTTIPLADPTGVQIALGNWVDDAVLCAIICLTALFAFVQERQEGMTSLLFSTKHGQTGTYFAKLMLIAGVGILASVLLTGFHLLIAGDLGDLSRPLQTIPAYYTSPYVMSIGQLLALSFLQRTAATLLVGLIMSLLCILLDRSLALGVAALIAGVQTLCWLFIDGNSVFQFLKYLSIPALFSDETLLGNAVYIKLFDSPVRFLWGYLILTVFGGCILTLLGCNVYRRTQKALSIPNRSGKVNMHKYIPSLFALEMKKLLIHQKAILLLILVISLQPSFYESFHSGLNINELRYLSVMAEVEGPYTVEKHESLRMEQTELIALQSTAGQLMSNELDQRLAAVNRVLSLSDYLSAQDESVSYVYEGGIEALLGIRPVGSAYQFPLLALVLCLILPGLFTLEQESGFNNLIRTTSGIRRLKREKWKIAFLLTFMLFLICWLPAVVFIFKTFELSGWTAPAISLQSLSGLPGWVPIWLQIAIAWLWRLLSAVLTTFLVGFVSDKIGKYIPSVLLSCVLLGAMMMLLN